MSKALRMALYSFFIRLPLATQSGCVHYVPILTGTEIMDMNKMMAVVARILLAQVYLVVGLYAHVYQSMTNPMFYEGFQMYLGSVGLPGVFAPLMILIEVAGGAMLLLGWKTRFSAWLLAAYSLFIALFFHHNFANPQEFLAFLQYVAVAGGLMLLAVHGATACSLDNLKK